MQKSRSMGVFEADAIASAAPPSVPPASSSAPVCPPKPATVESKAQVKKKKRLTVPREEIPWYPTIKPELCNGCGDCRVLCRPGVFELGPPDPAGIHRPKLVVANPYNCVVLCTRCVPICTSGAITLPPAADFQQYVEYVD